MRAMLAEWKDDDHEEANVFLDSDSERSENAEDATRRMALLRASKGKEEELEDDDDDDDEDDYAMVQKEVAVRDEEDNESEVSQSASQSESEYEEEVIEEGDDDDDDEEEDDDEVEVKEVEEDVGELEAHAQPTAKTNDDETSVADADNDDEIKDTLNKKPKKKKDKKKAAPLTAPAEGDTEEDLAMKALMADFCGGDDDDSDDDSNGGDDDDDESEASEREVVLEDGVIDHIVLAAPDLEQAIEQFEKMTGIAAKIVGSINGLGIRCARISFNDSTYLEIIAPDTMQGGPIGQLIKTKKIKELTPFHFAIRSSRAEALKTEVRQFGYIPDYISMFSGQKDGIPCKWEMLYLYGHKMGGICPFFINWSNTQHPCATLPVVGKLKKFTMRAPKDDPVHQLLEHVGVKGFNIEEGTPKLSFQLSSPEGTIKFVTGKAAGYMFPGLDDDDEDVVVDEDESEVVFETPEAPELLAMGDIEEYEALPPPMY